MTPLDQGATAAVIFALVGAVFAWYVTRDKDSSSTKDEDSSS